MLNSLIFLNVYYLVGQILLIKFFIKEVNLMNNKAFIIIGLILCLLFTIPMVSAAEVSAESDLIDNSVIGSNLTSQAIATSDANGLESNIDDINSNIDSNINAHDNANNGDIIEGLNDNNTEIDIGSNNDDDNDKITDINFGNKNSNDKNILGANALTAVGDGNTFTDLEYLINKAISEGATSFTLPRDFTFTSGDDDSLINGITINSPITIIGGSHTIDGSNLARIFVINSNNVYLNGITFKNANASSEASFGAMVEQSMFRLKEPSPTMEEYPIPLSSIVIHLRMVEHFMLEETISL